MPASRNFSRSRLEIHDMVHRFSVNLHTGSLLCVYLIGFLIMGSFVALYNYVEYPLINPPYSLSQTIVGFIFVIYLVGTFASTFMGRLANSHGPYKMLDISLVCMLFGVLLTLVSPLWLKIIGIAIFTFGFFGSHSIASGLVVKNSPIGKAQSSALYLLFYYLGSSVIGAVGGKFLTWQGWRGVVLLLSCAVIIALCLSNALLWRKQQ